MTDLASAIVAGDVRGIARGISLVENDTARGAELVRDIFKHSGRALVVGMTGSPGAGKSTLMDGLIARWRSAGRSVGVIAVDPTSPFSGGAVLGDRVRMQSRAQDSGVFIRSMATRGHLGGLARATADAVVVLDASGKEIVAIETVGVGQDEVDVARAADLSIVVLVPGMGDEVQSLKAGVLEIADVFVVNKTDREGADRTVAEIASLLDLNEYATDQWRPPIVRTQATSGEGLDALVAAIQQFCERSDRLRSRRRARVAAHLRSVLSAALAQEVESRLAGTAMDAIVDRVAAREIDPHTAARDILRDHR